MPDAQGTRAAGPSRGGSPGAAPTRGVIWAWALSGLLVGLLAAASYLWCDRPVALWVARLPQGWRDLATKGSKLGLAEYWLVPLALLAGWLFWRGRRAAALWAVQAFAAVGIAGLLVHPVKILAGRSRPGSFLKDGAWGFHPFALRGYDVASFPSGHAMVIGAVCVVLCRWQPRGWPLWLLLALAVGASRVGAQAHYMSDVMVGGWLGALVAWVVLRRAWGATDKRSLSVETK